MDHVQEEVLSVVERMTKAFHAGDINAVMSCYEKNASVMFEPGQVVSDAELMKDMFQNSFHLKPHFTYSGHEVFVQGNLAVHFAPWAMTGQTPDGAEVRQEGLSVAVLRKQEDGRWLMVIDNPHGQHLLQQD